MGNDCVYPTSICTKDAYVPGDSDRSTGYRCTGASQHWLLQNHAINRTLIFRNKIVPDKSMDTWDPGDDQNCFYLCL